LDTLIGDLDAAGYSSLLSLRRQAEHDVDVLLRRFLERRVDGLILWNATNAPSLKLYHQSNIPVLAIGFRDDDVTDIPLISMDPRGAFDEAFRRLSELGHRVVSEFVPVEAPNVAAHHAAAQASGIMWHQVVSGFEYDNVRRLLVSLMDGPERPTAVLAPYPTAVQILRACDELGLRIPQDFSLVSVTESEGAAVLRVPLASVRTDYGRFGHAAANAMVGALAGEQVSDLMVSDCLEWIERASIGPARQPTAPRSS
jgi:LacI family transcriptional regulator